jgi:hypothetical protein
MEHVIEKIQDYSSNGKDEKLYYIIFNFLTQGNTLTNFSHNKSGIRFNLEDFEITKLNELLVLIEEYQKTKNCNEEFLDEIKTKPKKVRK